MLRRFFTPKTALSAPPDRKWVARLRQIGLAASLFFLLKGLFWLAVGYVIVEKVN